MFAHRLASPVRALLEESQDMCLITRADLLNSGRVAVEEKLIRWAIQTLEGERLSVKEQARRMGLTAAGYLKMKMRLFPERPRPRGRRRAIS